MYLGGKATKKTDFDCWLVDHNRWLTFLLGRLDDDVWAVGLEQKVIQIPNENPVTPFVYSICSPSIYIASIISYHTWLLNSNISRDHPDLCNK